MASPGPANRGCRRDDSWFTCSGQRFDHIWQNPNLDRPGLILFTQIQVAADSFVTLSNMRGWLRDVTASVDGQITNLRLARGDYVSPTQPALAIVDANAWRVIANYKEYYIRHLPPRRQVRVWLDTNPWHLYRARVQGIAHAISRDQEASTLVPYVSPTVDWIRLDRRIPVRVQLINPPPPQNLFMGSDAWVFAIY